MKASDNAWRDRAPVQASVLFMNKKELSILIFLSLPRTKSLSPPYLFLFKCTVKCPVCLDTEHNLPEGSVRNRKKNSEQEYSCDKCMFTTKSMHNLNRHIRNIHEGM